MQRLSVKYFKFKLNTAIHLANNNNNNTTICKLNRSTPSSSGAPVLQACSHHPLYLQLWKVLGRYSSYDDLCCSSFFCPIIIIMVAQLWNNIVGEGSCPGIIHNSVTQIMSYGNLLVKLTKSPRRFHASTLFFLPSPTGPTLTQYVHGMYIYVCLCMQILLCIQHSNHATIYEGS